MSNNVNNSKEGTMSMFDMFSINVIVNGDNIRFIANEAVLALLRLKVIKCEDLVSGMLKQAVSGHLLSYVSIYKLSFTCNFEVSEANRVLLRESLIKNIIDYTEFVYNFDNFEEQLDYCNIMVNLGKMNNVEVMHFMNNYAHLSSYLQVMDYEIELEDHIDDINKQLSEAANEDLNDYEEYLDCLYRDYVREEDHNRMNETMTTGA